MSGGESEKRTDLAEDRTEKASERNDLAEDRTLLANERTFAGWCRTAFAAVGLGLGFHAIFKSTEPAWIAKSVATLFILIGVWTIWQARSRAAELLRKQSGNRVNPADARSFLIMAIVVSLGSATLLTAIWTLI